jgi:hypothetical protein
MIKGRGIRVQLFKSMYLRNLTFCQILVEESCIIYHQEILLMDKGGVITETENLWETQTIIIITGEEV